MATKQEALQVEGLRVEFLTDAGRLPAVRGVSFSLLAGETLGLVGESGCGKTLTALSVLRLVPPPGRIVSGRISLAGKPILPLSEGQMRRLRGDRVGMVFQEPTAALNPVLTVGAQIAEALRAHRACSRREAYDRAAELLAQVGVPAARQRLRAYPHELSGGMKQRVVIAMALACRPPLLIADEPTTALDVTVQAQILRLLLDLQRELSMALLLVTHDLGVVAQTCRRVLVMYAGRIVEEAAVGELMSEPLHPYTKGLLASLPRLDAGGGRLVPITGNVPELASLPSGCAFRPRCPEVLPVCAKVDPAAEETAPGRRCACHAVARRLLGRDAEAHDGVA